MKAFLILSVLLCGALAVSAAAVGPVEAAPQELQEENQLVENEAAVVAPEEENPEMFAASLSDENPEMFAASLSDENPEMFAASLADARFFSCPSGWIRYKDGCYLYVSSGRSWSSAAAYCSSLGASLASAQDIWDYTFLQELTRKAGHTVSWMGGFYFQGWRWLDQNSFSYTYWNAQNSVSSYQCIHLNARAGWSNNNCANSWPSICKRSTDTC